MEKKEVKNTEETIKKLEQDLLISQELIGEYMRELQSTNHRLILANVQINMLENQVKNSVPIEDISEDEAYINDLEG